MGPQCPIPTPFNVEGIHDQPLNETMVRNAARCGITAVNATVSQISCTLPAFESPRRLDLLAAAMSRTGHPDSRIEKMPGGNRMRLLGEVWKG